MRTAPLQSLLHFFVASFFSVIAQSFLLIPDAQKRLLGTALPVLVLPLSAVLLSLSYFNLTLVFYQNKPFYKRAVSGSSLLGLGMLVFLYIQAFYFVEALLFLFTGTFLFFLLLAKELPKNWLGSIGSLLNLVLGIIFVFPEKFFQASIYQSIFPLSLFFASSFIVTGLLGGIASLKPTDRQSYYVTKALAFPWIGWVLLFGINFSLAQFLPSFFFTFTLLAFGLIPFENFRLPDKKILGANTFFLLATIYALLLGIFTIISNFLDLSLSFRELLLLFSIGLGALFIYLTMRFHYLIASLAEHFPDKDEGQQSGIQRLTNFFFAPSQELMPISNWQADKINELETKLATERENGKRFDMLEILRSQLDEFHDDPVSAQLAVNTISHYFDAAIVAILIHDIETHELALYALSGKLKAYVPASYRQSINTGTLGRAARHQKVQVINDTSTDVDYFNVGGENVESEVFVPLLHHGTLKGILMVGAQEKDAFSAVDVRVLENVAKELLKTWEQSGYNRRLRTLIQSSISLSTSLEPQSAVEEITKVARETLLARFIFVTLLDQDGAFTRASSVGYAPNLLKYLSHDLADNPLLRVALSEKGPFRIRDIRRYKKTPQVPLDHSVLRGVMMVPIRLHGVNIGAIIAFGKQGAVFFSEKDEALGDLLATQAAAAIESSWLIQELRSNASTTNVLYNLSIKIIQTDTIREAARLIAETAQSLTKSSSVGIILFSLDWTVETALELGPSGALALGKTIPLQFVEQALASGEVITLAAEQDSATIYLPIQTSLRKYGVLWIEFSDNERQAAAQTQTLKTLANQAAMALERAMLLLDLRRKANELREALQELENSYDQTLSALMAALDARDRETEGHSARVGNVACRIGTELGLDEDQINVLRRGALLHDIGKIGVSDTILHKPDILTSDEWRIMRQHPEIGARIVRSIPFLAETMPVIRHHHERWNGSGYPLGLSGEDIPITARIFAVADVFDALTSIRPYRRTSSYAEAFTYLKKNAGILFDPKIVDVFEMLLQSGEIERLINE